MLRIIRNTAILLLAAYLGHLTAPTRVLTVPGPAEIIMPMANRGVEVQPGLRWVNLEAETPIFQVDNERTMRAIAGIPDSQPGFIEGLYTPIPDQAIYILGTWNLESETVVHEFVHMLENEMPDQAWRIRRVFHKLCSDKFRIDSMDLIPVLPEPEATVGIKAPK